MYSSGNWDSGHSKPEATCAVSCMGEDVLKVMGQLVYCHGKEKQGIEGHISADKQAFPLSAAHQATPG